MNSNQIDQAMKKNPFTSQYFGGVFAINTLPIIKKHEKKIYIVNNDTQSGDGNKN